MAAAADSTLADGSGLVVEPILAARLAGLRYVTDDEPGVRRRRSGRGFAYYDAAGSLVRDRAEILRFRSIGIPPAWQDVWICALPDGHLQATGRDARRRKQYRYHTAWRSVRDATKFDRMVAFGHALPRVRYRIEEDLARRTLDRARVLAAILRIVDETLIRVGNEEYARENGTFGATTMLRKHAEVTAARVELEFKSKHGKMHAVALVDPRVARVVRRCQDLPGQRLFAYRSAEGDAVPVSSEDVNDYVRCIAGDDFSVKDYRTCGGSAAFLRAMNRGGATVKLAVEEVAGKLGNTPAIARGSYIHPALLAAGADGALPTGNARPRRGLDACESALLRFLEDVEPVAWVSPPAGTATSAA